MKPRIQLHSMHILCEIDRYIKQYGVRGKLLHDAASDMLDGGYDRSELDNLIRHRLLTVIGHDEILPGDRCTQCNLCGSTWSVNLTDRAIDAFWPERKDDRPSPTHKRSVPRNRVRARRKAVRNLQQPGSGRSSHNGKKAVSR